MKILQTIRAKIIGICIVLLLAPSLLVGVIGQQQAKTSFNKIGTNAAEK